MNVLVNSYTTFSQVELVATAPPPASSDMRLLFWSSVVVSFSAAHILRHAFEDDEVKECGGWVSKGPQLVAGDGWVHLIAGCGGGTHLDSTTVGDPTDKNKIVIKSSQNGGVTWGRMKYVTPAGLTRQPQDALFQWHGHLPHKEQDHRSAVHAQPVGRLDEDEGQEVVPDHVQRQCQDLVHATRHHTCCRAVPPGGR